jgi:catechol 2,3-dioxygenase-like lactoylglutathione lyase family enzyme
MIKYADIISIPVSDQAKARAFYTDKLGFEVVRDNPMGPDRRWVEVAPKGAQTSFTLVTWFEKMPAGSVQGVVLDTDDLESEVAALKKRGLSTSAIEQQPWGRFVTFDDPDGNGFVLQQAAPGA